MPIHIVIDLLDVRPSDVNVVGVKAVRLGQLLAKGFPVPPGFCITAQACREFLSANGLVDELSKERILASGIPPAIWHDVLAAYKGLGSDISVAVRSSAVQEDLAEASFAGQYHTALDVSSEATLLNAIRECWASLFAPSAVAYRRQRNLSLDTALPLIIQRMAPAQAAGVMFTAYGNAGMVIEACQGVGEALVAGRVTPDRYVVARKSMTILDRALVEEDNATPVLPDTAVLELAKLGCRIESDLGEAQDVEWAWTGDRFYILQARPITTVLSALPDPCEVQAPAKPYDEWSRLGVGEAVPKPITPLGWSIWREPINDIMRTCLRFFNLPNLDQVYFFDIIQGWVYYNHGAVNHVYNEILGLPTISKVLGGFREEEITSTVSSSARVNWPRLLRHVPGLIRTRWNNTKLSEYAEREVPSILEKAAYYRSLSLSKLSEEELWQSYQDITSHLKERITMHSDPTSAAFSAVTFLNTIIRKWCNIEEAGVWTPWLQRA
jgi:pyruvate,water dikinase